MLKDIGATLAGVPSALGMRYLKQYPWVPARSSYYTQKLEAAGFVICGKTNTPELGILPTTEPEAFGATRNPHDLSRSPGGSSGGAAAAVAAGMVPVAHASDGGGSIRIPASCCGLVGLKVSRGRTSPGPLAGELANGLAVEHVVSRSVRDSAALLDVLAGPMPGDPYAAPAKERPFLEEVGAEVGQLRIGWSTRFIGVDGARLDADPECREAVEVAARLLEQLGHAVEERPIAALEEADYPGHFMCIWSTGVHAGLLAIGGDGPREIERTDVEPLTWGLAEMGKSVTSGGYANAWAWLRQHAYRVAEYFEELDLYLTPTLATPPAAIGAFDQTWDEPLATIYQAAEYAPFTPPFNGTGQPAISLPLHRTESGLPIGVQLVAAYGREDLLLRVAAQLERAAPWPTTAPPL